MTRPRHMDCTAWTACGITILRSTRFPEGTGTFGCERSKDNPLSVSRDSSLVTCKSCIRTMAHIAERHLWDFVKA